MEFQKEELILCRRFKELAGKAFQKGFPCYSDFLNLNEINLFYSILKELPQIEHTIFGGYPDAERKMVCFCENPVSTELCWPIDIVKVQPSNKKFSDTLNHRDFLGAVLNLGLERNKIGDILIQDKEAYIFCHSKISPFIIENLVKIKHTNISASPGQIDGTIKQERKEITGTVSSLRLDSVLSVAFQTSRSSLNGLAAAGKVFVNGRIVMSNSYTIKENDVVSVRGLGKFAFAEVQNQTKKGRYYIKIQKYI